MHLSRSIRKEWRAGYWVWAICSHFIEKAQEDYDDEKAKELEKRLRKNQFTLEDFLEQMGQIRKMGGIAKVLGMMPGMNSNAMKKRQC